jgi:Tol biopolymer transport system component
VKPRILLAALVVALALGSAGCGGAGEPGQDMAFVSTRDGDYAIFGMDADGGAQGRLSDEHPADDLSPQSIAFQLEPSWSPDGTQIVFMSAREGTSDLYVMNADGTGTRRLTSTRDDDSHPSWSPDGRRIAFQRGQGSIYLMSPDGSDLRRVTDELAVESDPTWSPDGRWLAYERRAPGTDVREIWLTRPDGSGRRRLTRLNAVSNAPTWSPDGETIAFSSDQGGRRFEIYSIGMDGRNLRQLTHSIEDDSFEPAWSPDGGTLAFSRGGAILTIDRDGNQVELTDPENNDSSPAWNPSPPAEGS